MTVVKPDDPQGAQALAARLHREGLFPSDPEMQRVIAAHILGEHGFFVADVRELRAEVEKYTDPEARYIRLVGLIGLLSHTTGGSDDDAK